MPVKKRVLFLFNVFLFIVVVRFLKLLVFEQGRVCFRFRRSLHASVWVGVRSFGPGPLRGVTVRPQLLASGVFELVLRTS